MSLLLPSSVQRYLDNASLEELDLLNHQVYWRMRDLTRPQGEIEHLCTTNNWRYTWYAHPGIPGAIFFCVWYGNRYQEFLGFHRNLQVASNLAAERALHYFSGRKFRRQYQLETAVKKCLDIDLEAIQDGLDAFHDAKQSGKTIEEAESAANNTRQKLLKDHLEVFLEVELVRENTGCQYFLGE